MSNITVRHAKISNIADHPVSVNAGEVVPSDWNADHNVTVTSLDGVPIGSVTPSTGTFTTVTANDKVSLKNGTAPTSGDANTVHVYSSDLRTDATIPSVWTEGNIAADVSPTANRAIPIRINGTVYYLLASSVDYSTSPTLDLNFAASTSLDSRVTFTRASNATYFNSAGTLTTAGNNVARLDYNPSTLAARGLLIEEQRTNVCRQSEDFATTWTLSEATISTNTTTAPDGTASGDTLIPSVVNTTHIVTQGGIGSLDRATQRVISVFVKLSGYQGIRIQDNAFSNNFTRGFFNISTLTASTSVGGNGVASGATITDVGNGWYRCSYVSTPNTTTGGGSDLSIAVIDTGTNVSFAGNGTSGVVLWGAQVEAGAFPTSYIKTTAAAATRNADVASVNTLSPWYNATTGTLLGEFSGVASGTRTIAALDDNTANESIVLQTVSTDPKFTVTDGGSTQTDLDAGTVATGTIYKLAGAFASGDFAACIGGGTVQTDATGTVPAVDRLRLGTSQAGNYLNGHVRRVAYYPVRLANASLQTITT